MNLEWLFGSVSAIAISVLITKIIVQRKANRLVAEFKTIEEAIDKSTSKLNSLHEQAETTENKLAQLNEKTKDLQQLRVNATDYEERLIAAKSTLSQINTAIEQAETDKNDMTKVLHELMSKLDLYSRIEEFVDHGLYEEPDYLFETSARFTLEIKKVREKQKELIKKKQAVLVVGDLMLWSPQAGQASKSYINRIIEGQRRLLLSAFNIECDMLISKVSPSNLNRTLSRIDKLASKLEKTVVDLHCGISKDYVLLKYEECSLQYQFQLKKKEEREEQAYIREQIREEQKIIKEYEKALAEAEAEEKLYLKLLTKAREELSIVSEDERISTELRIAELEEKLAEAEQREQRAKSLAEMTRRGHVYVISNIGSFGEDIFKIGMTRRLDPLDRVKELGDASVPFKFDIHAIIYAEDAPTLERSLHRKFKDKRVNAVNLRKEFFFVQLEDIKSAVEEFTGNETEFRLTILAEEYYETLRLQGEFLPQQTA